MKIKFSFKHLFIIEQDSLIFSLNIPVFNFEKNGLVYCLVFFIYKRRKNCPLSNSQAIFN